MSKLLEQGFALNNVQNNRALCSRQLTRSRLPSRDQGYPDAGTPLLLLFESRCELVRQTERCRHNSRAKDVVEDAVPTRKVPIFKPPNDLGTRKAERSCAVENKSSDRVGVLAVSQLDRRSPKVYGSASRSVKRADRATAGITANC